MAPQRIRLSRKKGQRKPAGAIVVARPTMYGNPFPVSPIVPDRTRAHHLAVSAYRAWITQDTLDPDEWSDGEIALHVRVKAALEFGLLTGRDLACWCRLDEPCHADVLLELANREAS